MKNIILTLSLLMVVSLGYSQIKVVTSGNVGVGGVNNPQEALDVDGDVQIRGKTLKLGEGMGSGIAAVRMGFGRTVNGSTTFDLISDVNNYNIYGFRFTRNSLGSTQLLHRGNKAFNVITQDGARVRFEIGSTEAMRIEDDLRVGIGTNNPNALLHVNGDIMNAGGVVTSDKRLKKDFSKFESGLNQVLQIQPYTFFYNGEAGIKSDKLQFGVMAQDMEEILPEMVGTYRYQLDDPNDPEEKALLVDEEYKYIDPSAIQYMLVNSIKEQQEMINELSDLVLLLEEKISLLEKTGGQTITAVDLTYHDMASLEQNTPNPFTGTTEINYTVPSNAKTADVEIYNIAGKKIKTVKIDHLGEGKILLNAVDMPGGTYMYRLIVDNKLVQTRKMVLSPTH